MFGVVGIRSRSWSYSTCNLFCDERDRSAAMNTLRIQMLDVRPRCASTGRIHYRPGIASITAATAHKYLTKADAVGPVTLLITVVLLYLKVPKVFDGELSQNRKTVMESSFSLCSAFGFNYISQRHLYRCRLHHVLTAIPCPPHHPYALEHARWHLRSRNELYR